MLIGAISPFRFILTTVSQLVGAIVAAAIVDGLTPGTLSVACVLGSGVNRTQGLFIEMFTTSALTLSVLMLAAEKSRFTPMAPLGFGMTLMVVMLFSTQYTGGAVNTARAFGPAVITGFTDYHWIYCKLYKSLVRKLIDRARSYSRQSPRDLLLLHPQSSCKSSRAAFGQR